MLSLQSCYISGLWGDEPLGNARSRLPFQLHSPLEMSVPNIISTD
ncbi:hypothetical protein [Microcoleus sp. FACHB-831]|nr:hypothetical protein [Microcoleus sp. FACHB-831]